MTFFVHRFSEFGRRPGPFGATFADFAGLDLRGRRESHRRQNEAQEYWDPETGEYEVFGDYGAAETADSLFRYRLVVFSNFLTVGSAVETHSRDLELLFADLRPGAVIIVLGGTGTSYQDIYERIADIARRAGLREAGWHTDTLGRIKPTDSVAKLVKESQHRVYQYLAAVVGSDGLKRDRAWPDYWSPKPSARARPKFSLRVFRKGRWRIQATRPT